MCLPRVQCSVGRFNFLVSALGFSWGHTSIEPTGHHGMGDVTSRRSWSPARSGSWRGSHLVPFSYHVVFAAEGVGSCCVWGEVHVCLRWSVAPGGSMQLAVLYAFAVGSLGPWFFLVFIVCLVLT